MSTIADLDEYLGGVTHSAELHMSDRSFCEFVGGQPSEFIVVDLAQELWNEQGNKITFIWTCQCAGTLDNGRKTYGMGLAICHGFSLSVSTTLAKRAGQELGLSRHSSNAHVWPGPASTLFG